MSVADFTNLFDDDAEEQPKAAPSPLRPPAATPLNAAIAKAVSMGGITPPKNTVSHTPTDEQLEVIRAVAQASSSLMIGSYAGCTKSTTLEMAAPGVKGPALALAFNKKIATELQDRLPSNFKSQTLNSIGHGAWLRTLDRVSVKLDDKKLGKIVTAVARDRKIPLMTWQWEIVRNGVKAAMQAGLSPGDVGQPLIKDSEENWEDLLDCPSKDDFDLLYELAHESLRYSIDLAKAGQMSFDDQIYCPTILGGNWPRYPYIFVDEAQDLSPLNHVMLDRCSIGLIAAVGDPKQAIYLFRGADGNSMNNMRWLKPKWQDLTLTMTFRCPKAVVARQQDHAPGYRAAPTNADGLFTSYDAGSRDEQGTWNWRMVKDRLSDIDARNMAILCRNNAPLMSMAFKLIRQGVGCEMLGRDIGRGLIALTTKLAKDDETPIKHFSTRLTDWLDKEVAISIANDKEQRADRLVDQAECIRATIEGSSPLTVGELRETLKTVFDKSNGQVLLSSIHKAKGLEWPLVLHLDPWRIPSKQSQMAAANGDTSQLIQEYNLKYVAETRTKHTLINASVDSFESNS